ncbi:MAG: MarR family transcriptional regulator [Myxococcales bacterium]|nr:MarR family transcriptional regulator [Myxococcales bacterium]
MARKAQQELVHAAIAQLQRLTDLFQQRRQELARRVGLTEQQWRVLEEISTEHFMPSMFARQSESSPAAVSKILRQLLDKELVRVSVSEDDGRQRQYGLSEAGERVMKELRAYRARAIERIWSNLPADQLGQFNELARELVARIETYSDEE